MVLRDPWDEAGWEGRWSDGSKEWTKEWLEVLPELAHYDGPTDFGFMSSQFSKQALDDEVDTTRVWQLIGLISLKLFLFVSIFGQNTQ